jgi:hypothetical protein
VLILLLDDLYTELPLGVGTSLDGIVQISSVEVGVLPVELQCLVPYQTVCAEMRGPVVLDKGTPSILIEQAEGVD